MNTIVTLSVDTATINPTNKKDKIVFSDNRGDTENPGHPDVYTSKVDSGAKITWKGVNNDDNGYTIKISNVVKCGGSVLIVLPPNYHDNKATADVNVGVSSGTEEKYDISFKIMNGRTEIAEYTIDPRLRMT